MNYVLKFKTKNYSGHCRLRSEHSASNLLIWYMHIDGPYCAWHVLSLASKMWNDSQESHRPITIDFELCISWGSHQVPIADKLSYNTSEHQYAINKRLGRPTQDVLMAWQMVCLLVNAIIEFCTKYSPLLHLTALLLTTDSHNLFINISLVMGQVGWL